MGKTVGNSSKSEKYMYDRNGIPIPILGFSANDAESITKSSAVTTNTTVSLTVGQIYMIVISQADTADSGVLIVDVQSPSNVSKLIRFASFTGCITLVVKARETDMKLTHVASANSTGFIVSVARLA